MASAATMTAIAMTEFAAKSAEKMAAGIYGTVIPIAPRTVTRAKALCGRTFQSWMLVASRWMRVIVRMFPTWCSRKVTRLVFRMTWVARVTMFVASEFSGETPHPPSTVRFPPVTIPMPMTAPTIPVATDAW